MIFISSVTTDYITTRLMTNTIAPSLPLPLLLLLPFLSPPLSLPSFPPQRGEDDVSQFDTRFTRLTPIDSPVDSNISASADLNFKVQCMYIQCTYMYCYVLFID